MSAARWISRTARAWLAIGVSICGMRAQGTFARTGCAAPQTRAARIECEREQKAANLKPARPSKIQRKIRAIEKNRIFTGVLGGTTGLHAQFGNALIVGSGFAMGPEYDHVMFDGQATLRTSASISVRKFYLVNAGLDMPALAGNHAFADLYAVHLDYPQLDYYGPGPKSLESGRTDFRLENTGFLAHGGWKPHDHLYVGALGGALLVNVGPGTAGGLLSTDRVYNSAETPGIQHQSNFLRSGGFIRYDWRNNVLNPDRGGDYVAEYSTYSDVKLERFSFDRLRLEAKQYIPFFNGRRIIALRGRVEASDAHAGNQVPFYLQPTLGGPYDLRGFPVFRFYGNNSLLLTAEYRWRVAIGLQMAIFVDSGRVYNDWHDIGIRNMETDAGFGFRGVIGKTIFRVDTGFSRDGAQVWFRFDNPF